jgi:excisionase family DNA binding protein
MTMLPQIQVVTLAVDDYKRHLQEVAELAAELAASRTTTTAPAKFWTLAECAAELKIDADTIQKWAVAGRIPGAKIGREWRFLSADVLAWFRQGGTAGADPIHAAVETELAERRKRKNRRL